ncbi:MAG TPA: hypothetical protein VGE97_08770 [Nitrososphaera sp.]|jgi:hypothetical protein
MTPRELVDAELGLINLMFEKQHEIYPMCVIVKDHERYLIPVSLPNNARKDVIAQGIRDLVKRSNPDIVIFVAEAWVTIVKSKLDRMQIPPYSHEKVEMISAHIEFKTGEKYGCEARIIREPGKLPRLEKFDVTDGKYDMGRFCDFFPIERTH